MPNRHSHRQSHRHSHRQPHRHSHHQPHRQPRRHSRPIQWFDEYTDYLVKERRRRNDEFHNEYGRDRSRFWRVFAFIVAVSLEEDGRVSEQDIIAHLDRDFGKDEIRDTIVEGQETYLRIVTEDNLLILLYYFIVSS
ncbi:hypothetical protein RclHR1_00580001 [Rhizophagus clarus]|uniref:Uncharacterized protein n=1 Tax=Rhizophagus clarus TaxID=94130 RepID=A0A2Z6RP85_9GLOM|nr:hypothetical protein RclHR1_00580001 [Rhizophagus clarus]